MKDQLYFLHFNLNPYNFVSNNPINRFDINGLTDLPVVLVQWGSTEFSNGGGRFYYWIPPSNLSPISAVHLPAQPGHLSPLIDGDSDDPKDPEPFDLFEDNPLINPMSGGITGDPGELPYIWNDYRNNIHGGGGSGRRKGSSDNRKNENYTKNRVSHIITISVNGAWVRTFGGNFEAGIAINLTTREMTPYLKFGPSLGEGKTIGIEVAYQRQSWKDFFGYGAELEGSFGKLGINIPIADRPYFDLGDFVGFGGSWGIGGGSIINFQGPAVHTNPISLYSI